MLSDLLACSLILLLILVVIAGIELDFHHSSVYNDGLGVYKRYAPGNPPRLFLFGGITMALTDSNLWAGTLTFRDKDGNKSSTTIYEDGALLYAAASAAFATKAGLAGALSDAELVSITITRTFNDPNLLVNGAGPNSDVERKGAFVFVDAQYKPVTVSIPSLKYGLTVEGSNVIAPGQVDVAAFVVAINATGRTYRNLDIIRLIEAEKRHVNSSKG